MPDVFISYSRKDSEQALQLAELLSSAGLTCWIDTKGIDVATSWSAEIVDAIDECKAFVILLSSSSAGSHNVAKELALASERRKKILPLDLEPIELPREFAYQLAGIQRSPMTNIDSIIRTLGKLGLEATGAPQAPTITRQSDGRKSLMILPFEDLSPTGDNGWFADGLASELISALTNVKALRVADPQATKEFKRYQGTLPKYAHEMSIQYFVQGDVRKFGDQIKITTRLLDIETGDFLWHDSMKGTMQDIFDIQEKVAERVVEGLRVHLDSEERRKLATRGTESVEAYELCMKSNEFFNRQTKDGFQLAVQLLREAIKLDQHYAQPRRLMANALLSMYRSYDRTPALLEEAESLCKEALRLQPDLISIYGALSPIYLYQHQIDKALEVANQFVRQDPENFYSHYTLGIYYDGIGENTKAILAYEESVRLKPENLFTLWNLVVQCHGAGEQAKCEHWARVALPLYEREIRLHPDDEYKRVNHAVLLHMSGKNEEAINAARRLVDLKDASSLYNVASLFSALGEKIEALRILRRAIEAGFSNTKLVLSLLTNEDIGLLSLQRNEEYEFVMRMVEKLDAQNGMGEDTGDINA